MWSASNSSTLIPPIFTFTLSVLTISINSVHLVNYLLSRESLNFVYIEKLLSKKSNRLPFEEKLVKIYDKLDDDVTVVSESALDRIANLK